jgi:hypothetical protein
MGIVGPGGGGDVNGPGSSIVDQIAVYDDATGKLLAAVPVTIDAATRKMAGLGVTEQDGHAYFPTFPANIGLWWTDDGLATGSVRLAIRSNNSGTMLISGAEGSRVNVSSSQFRILISTADTALYVIGGITTENNLNVQGDAKFKVYTNDVSNPPTDAELDAIFGTPATVGAGFTADIDDAGAGTNFYTVKSDGTNWWITTYTKAV